MKRRLALEDLLLEEGLLDEVALRHARRHARKNGVSLARAVVEEGLSDEALAEAVARKLRLPRIDLTNESVDDDALREVPYDLADTRRLLPLSIERAGRRRVIRVAMADPLDIDAVEEIELSTGCQLVPAVARAGDLAEATQRHYRGVITKMIPRKFGLDSAPTTQKTHKVTDEGGAELRLQALVDLLAERGLVDKDALAEAVRRLIKERAGE